MKYLYKQQKIVFSASNTGEYLNNYWTNDVQMQSLKMMMHYDEEQHKTEPWKKETNYLSIRKPNRKDQEGKQLYLNEFKAADILPPVKAVYNEIFPDSAEEAMPENDKPTEPTE